MLTLSNNAKSLNEIRRDIALVTLDIESLDHESKEMAILHLKETIDLLQFESHNKRVKQDHDAKESPEKKIKPDPNKQKLIINDREEYSFTKSLYRGLIPSCDICSSTFVTVGALDIHMKANHADIKQDVEIKDTIKIKGEEESKGKTIPNPSVGNDNEMYKCDQCNVYLPKSFPLQRHEEDLNHQARIALLAEMNEEAKRKDATFNSYKHQETFQCQNECQRKFRSQSRLKHHSCNMEVLQCPHCKKYYTGRQSMTNHLITHSDRFKCSKCETGFQTNSALLKHNCERLLKRRSNPDPASLIDCSECGMRLTKGAYQTHKIEHTDKFQCVSCKSGFSSQTSLEQHQTNPQNCYRVKRIRETKRRVSLLNRNSTTELKEKDTPGQKVIEETNSDIRKETSEDTDGEEEEDVDDFEMVNCEVCLKYFVSMESLENHKSVCRS